MRENRWWGSILEDYYSYGLDYLNGFEEMVKKLDVPSVHAYAKKTLTQGNSVNVIMRPAESK
jgi:zinc protease